jgi:hypothetical protein
MLGNRCVVSNWIVRFALTEGEKGHEEAGDERINGF